MGEEREGEAQRTEHDPSEASQDVARGGLFAAFRWPVSLDAVWLVLPMSLIVLLLQLRPADYWWPIVMGRLAWQRGAIVQASELLYTIPADTFFFNQPWLAQLVMYGVHAGMGHQALIALSAGLVWLSFGLMADVALRRGAPAALVGLGSLLWIVVAGDNLMVRTQIFALACFAGCFWLIAGLVDGWIRRRVFAAMGLVTITALWVNLHGAFVLAPLMVGAAFAGALIEQWRAGSFDRRVLGFWLVVLVACALATFLNPHGPMIYGYIANLMSAVRDAGTGKINVEEWTPLDPTSARGMLCLGTVALSVVCFAAQRARVRLADVFIFGGMAVLAWRARRNVVWMALVVVPVVLPLIKSWLDAQLAAQGVLDPEAMPAPEPVPPTQGAINLALALGGVLVAVLQLPPLPLYRTVFEATHAPEVVQQSATLLAPENQGYDTLHPLRLAQELHVKGYPGRLFHEQRVAGLLEYVMLEEGARPLVFVDQRFGMIPPHVWEDYHAIEQAAETPGAHGPRTWREAMARHDIQTVLVNDKGWRVNNALLDDPAWVLVGRELDFRLFMRAAAPKRWPALQPRPSDRLRPPGPPGT